MATLFQAPPHSNSYHHRRNHRQGILLSPSPTSSVTSNYPNPYEHSTSLSSGSPSGSGSSSSSTSSHTSLSSGSTPTNIPAQKPATPSRRIRFAPLPDPRRSVLITDDGDELPLPEAHDATQFPCPATPLAGEFPLEHSQIDTSSIGSSSSSSQRNSYSTDPSSVSSTPGTATPVSITIQSDSCDGSAPASPTNSVQQPTVVPAKSSWPKPKSLNILRSFKKSSSSSSSGSSHTLTPTPSIEKGSRGVTKEEILTLGTINLFRSSSRESRNGSESDPGSSSSGWGLTRWTSAGGTSGKLNSDVGSPLARTQSTQSYTSKSKRPSSTGGLFYTPSPSRSKAAPVKQNTVRTGTRMLNGRVYGGPKRPQTNANPFANARDEEPEFVEWGYGGMGSVKGAKSAGVSGAGWEKLHGGASVSAKGKQAGGSGEDGDAEEDDGSGLGWVKRRKEERERKKKEEEERRKAEEAGAEKTEAEAEAETPALPPLSADSTPTVESPGALSPAIRSLHAPARPTTPSSTHTHGEEEHVLRAVTVPAPMPRHHRGHSRGNSINNSTLSLSHAPANETLELPKAVEENKDEEGSDEDEDEGSEEEEEARRTPEEGDEEEEEEDEDEEERERERRTALGAGVEKISRHKEIVEGSGEA